MQATEQELVWVARAATVALGTSCLILCAVWQGWHSVWLLPYDILYVLVFPQLFSGHATLPSSGTRGYGLRQE